MKAPPPRLIDDPTVAPGLRSDLERAANAGPAYDVAAGLAGFAATVGTATSTATTTSTSTSASAAPAPAAAGKASVIGAMTGKAVVATVVAAAAVATAVVAWPAAHSVHQPARAAHVHSAAPAERAAPVAKPQPIAPEAQADAPAVAEPAPAPEPVATPAAQRAQVASAHDDDGELRREIAQLAQIKALVGADPARAYRLSQQGDREFARGMLRQERAALAIDALANSGRVPEARQRTRVFLTRYPHSPAREHLEQLLGTERE